MRKWNLLRPNTKCWPEIKVDDTYVHHLHRMDLRTINRRRTFFVMTKLGKICLEFNTVPKGCTERGMSPT